MEPSSADLAAVAGWLHLQREASAGVRSPGLAGWCSSGVQRSRQRLAVRGMAEPVDVDVTRTAAGLTVTACNTEHVIELSRDGVAVDGATVGLVTVRPEPVRVLAHLPHVEAG